MVGIPSHNDEMMFIWKWMSGLIPVPHWICLSPHGLLIWPKWESENRSQ